MPKYLRYASPTANLRAVHVNLARFKIISDNVKDDPNRYPYFIQEFKDLISSLLLPPLSVSKEDLTMLLDLIVIVDDTILIAACLSRKEKLLDIAVSRYSKKLEESFSDILLNIIANDIYSVEETEMVVNNFLVVAKKYLGYLPLASDSMDLLYIMCSRFCRPRLIFDALMSGIDPTKPNKVGLSYILSFSNYYEAYNDIDSQINIAISISLLMLFAADLSETIHAPLYDSIHGKSLHFLLAKSTETHFLGYGSGSTDMKTPPIIKWLDHLCEIEAKHMEDLFYVKAIRIIDSKPQGIDKKIISPLYAATLFHMKAQQAKDIEMTFFSYQLFHKLVDILQKSTIFTLSVASYSELRSFIKDNKLKDLDNLLDRMEDCFLTSMCYMPSSVETMPELPAERDIDIARGSLKLG